MGTARPGRVRTLFADRTNWDREEALLSERVAAVRADGGAVLDLTASNPTRCGFRFEAERLLAPLAAPGALEYEPLPFGREQARAAVAGYYAERGAAVEVEDLCLCTSTSEAYSFLFRLLCNAGDEVLIATPSYPLFPYLAALHDVRLVEYPLLYEHGWQLEPGALDARITERTRAIVLVHPNNPTGHFVGAQERAAIEALCVRHGLALLVDEVFLDYAVDAQPRQSFASALPGDAERPLVFVLSGMSKVAALPQMKLSWIAVCGPEGLRHEARERLEIIADTFLSVSAPVQHALPAWLAECGAMQAQIRARVAENIRLLDGLIKDTHVSRLEAEGGWYAVLRYPAVVLNEALALGLLEQRSVLVYPGEAFGFATAGWVVVSLLPECAEFARGAGFLVGAVEAVVAEARGA
ncbi:pyridoxal phosphate-dependent aminotransferase [Acidipila sp. EB88]|uniref:pyridoxal phosphate-dependent aminotransferase n=1 Tax=Acidipila sp. EB88 TaxID=2305226 RepID=UPI000F5E72FE|nr:pyridoxal phosphate-dependent aminotransferase [Acidipila sp. EB88]RRA49498.1 pyridoxal phosphate-dependent aminotransferase [Acidipila sp. EB88]